MSALAALSPQLPVGDWFAAPPVTLATTFARNAFVDLTPYIAPALVAFVREHVRVALDTAGHRRDLTLPTTGNSPRRYTLALRESLAATGPWINELYHHPALGSMIASITGSPIASVPFLPEQYVATRLDRVGDTHGWHWDDYSYALIWVLSAPPPDCGGALEYVRNVPWNKHQPDVEAHLQAGPIHRYQPASGTIYLLRSDTTLHRVAPLKHSARREMLCLSYASTADLQRTIVHETVQTLADGSF